MTARDALDAIKARLEAATPGPWKPYRTGKWEHDNYVVREDLHGVATQYALVWQPGDAEFIAHAPTDLAAMHAALTAVLALADLWDRDGEVECWGRDIRDAVAAGLQPKEDRS